MASLSIKTCDKCATEKNVDDAIDKSVETVVLDGEDGAVELDLCKTHRAPVTELRLLARPHVKRRGPGRKAAATAGASRPAAATGTRKGGGRRPRVTSVAEVDASKAAAK